jgi:thymidylate synthase
MKELKKALRFILKNGKVRTDRTGEGTIGIFGYQMRFDLSKYFPAVTTKKLALNAVITELLWFLEGSGDEKRLREILHGDRDSLKPTIWTPNSEFEGRPGSPNQWLTNPNRKFVGDLGRIYGVNWRSWLGTDGKSYDQIAILIESLKKDPYSRRHMLSAWKVDELDKMALPPCHTFSQFYVQDGKLSCQMYQRSADFFLGVPFNIASYALLTHMIAQVCDLEVGEFIHTFGDAHIYLNHIEKVEEQLSRKTFKLPQLEINKSIKNINDFSMNDFSLINYKHHSAIKAPMAV